MRLAILMHRYGHLPQAGGLLDQDPELIECLWHAYHSDWRRVMWPEDGHG